jgi:tryptophanyl-tRNA synthetase
MNNVLFQSEEFDAKLYFELLSIARVGELERMTQYMSGGDDNDAHLLVYPVLMVHDIFGYDDVYVGEDQTQHVNYARDLIQRYNRVFGGDTVLPVAVPIGGRVMSLTEPTKKMSKSEPDGCLFLDDSPEEIRRKIKAATMTDEGRQNLIDLYRDLGGNAPIPEMNSEFKPMVSEQIIGILHPKAERKAV